MAVSNGRLSHRMGGNRPSFLLICLCIVIIILLYSYWSLSSRNTLLLQDITLLRSRLRTLTKDKMKHVSTLTSLNRERDSLKEKVKSEIQMNAAAKSETNALNKELEKKSKLLEKLQRDEAQNRNEVQYFKESTDSTSKKFKLLNETAGKVVILNKQLITKNKKLQQKIKELESQLSKHRMSKNLEVQKQQAKAGRKVGKTSNKPNPDQHTPSVVKKEDLEDAGEKNPKVNKTDKSVKPSRNITTHLGNETKEVLKTPSETLASHGNSKHISKYARGTNATVTSPREFGSVSSETKTLTRMTTADLSNFKTTPSNFRKRVKSFNLGARFNDYQKNQGLNFQRERGRSYAADGSDDIE